MTWDPQPYVCLLADALGLRDFVITARVDDFLEDSAAAINTDDSNDVTIRISLQALGRGPEYVRVTVIHELLHLHSRTLWALTKSIGSASDSGDLIAAFGEMVNHGEEQLIDRCAKLLAPHYPLPELHPGPRRTRRRRSA